LNKAGEILGDDVDIDEVQRTLNDMQGQLGGDLDTDGASIEDVMSSLMGGKKKKKSSKNSPSGGASKKSKFGGSQASHRKKTSSPSRDAP